MNKVLPSADAAVALIPDGATILMGGFGLCGIPENLIQALHARGTKDLTVISNNAGVDDFGIGMLLRARQVRKMIATYVGENKEFERQYPDRRARSRARAAGHVLRAHPRRRRRHRRLLHADRLRHDRRGGQGDAVIDGKPYVLESPLRADFAFVKAWKGDRLGNLVYRRTARNFNP